MQEELNIGDFWIRTHTGRHAFQTQLIYCEKLMILISHNFNAFICKTDIIYFQKWMQMFNFFSLDLEMKLMHL